MDRADMATFLDSELPGYRTEFSLANWDAPIDAALRLYGISESDLASPTIPESGYNRIRELSLFTAFSTVERVAGRRVNISVGNPASSKAAGDAFERIRKLRIDQGKVIGGLGYSTGRGMMSVLVPVPYLEPESSED